MQLSPCRERRLLAQRVSARRPWRRLKSAVALVEDVGQLQQRRMSVHEGAQVDSEGGGLYHAADEQRGPRGEHVGLEIVDGRLHRQQRQMRKAPP